MGKTVYQNLADMGAEGRALGLSLERIQADANCAEQWERDAVAEGFRNASRFIDECRALVARPA